jgi:hypothetical protein
VADTTISAVPKFITNPYIQIGTSGSAVIFGAVCSRVALTPSQDENTVETFGGVYTSYKAEKWILEASIPMSYTVTTGAWTALRALCNTIQPFEVRPDATTVGTSNPKATGSVFVKSFGFVDAAPGEASEVDLIFACQGVPTFATT